MLETSCNLAVVLGKLQRISQLNRSEITVSLHLPQKLHWRVRQKSHQKTHVNGPLHVFLATLTL